MTHSEFLLYEKEVSIIIEKYENIAYALYAFGNDSQFLAGNFIANTFKYKQYTYEKEYYLYGYWKYLTPYKISGERILKYING